MFSLSLPRQFLEHRLDASASHGTAGLVKMPPFQVQRNDEAEGFLTRAAEHLGYGLDPSFSTGEETVSPVDDLVFKERYWLLLSVCLNVFGKRRQGHLVHQPDVDGSRFSVEVKWRTRLPALLEGAMSQAERFASADRPPLVVLYQKHARRGFVVMRTDTFSEWFGKAFLAGRTLNTKRLEELLLAALATVKEVTNDEGDRED